MKSETLSDTIYSNLSLNSQLKLKKISKNIKNEVTRLRGLIINQEVSIEKKIACMPNMPDQAKIYIMDKVSEIKSGENNYKNQTAINGLMIQRISSECSKKIR